MILPFGVLRLVAEHSRQDLALSSRPGFEAKAHESTEKEHRLPRGEGWAQPGGWVGISPCSPMYPVSVQYLI